MHVTCILVLLLGCRLSEEADATLLLLSGARSNVTRPRFHLASLAMLQLKCEACLLVGKLLEMKGLTDTAICKMSYGELLMWNVE